MRDWVHPLADFPYSAFAWLPLFISGFFGLGFLVIRFMPSQLPIRTFYIFYRLRRPVLEAALLGGVVVFILLGFPTEGWFIIGLQALFLLLDLITDEARIFSAVRVPEYEDNPSLSKMDPRAPVVLLVVGSDARAYPLTYVAHHEVVNENFGGRKVVISFCNQCNAVMTYEVTGYSQKSGFAIASEYRGNAVMKDLDTHTIWQQVTGESLAGFLHPSRLPLFPFQTVPWGDALNLYPEVKLAKTTAKERQPFNLRFFPWSRLQRSNYILGLHQRDRRLPARARILGIQRIGGDIALLKDEVWRKGWVRLDEIGLLLVVTGDCVNGFFTEVDGGSRELVAREGRILDRNTGSAWNLRGHGLSGPLKGCDLVAWPVHDQFWFAWSEHHGLTKIVRMEAA